MTHQLMRDFSIGAAQLGILSAGFYYAYTIMQIPAGLLIDRLGARKLLSFAVLVSACGVTLFGFSDSLGLAGFSRFLIGLGSSFAFISALFLVSRWFSHRYFALIAGFIQLSGSLGSIFGLAPLAKVINHFGWREAMIATGLVTFVLAIVYWFVIRDGQPEKIKSLNKEKKQSEWKRLKTVIKNKQMWWIALVGLVSWVPVACIGALWGVPYLMKVYGWSNTAAGSLCSLFWIGLGLGSPFIGWLSDKIKSRRKPMVLCFGIGIAGTFVLLDASQLTPTIAGLGLFLMGFSSSVQSLTFGLVKDIIPSRVFGTASGFNNMAAIVGGAITQPLVGFLLSWQWNGVKVHGVPAYSIHDYQTALIVLPIAAGVGIATVWFKLKETHCKKQTSAIAS